MKNYQKLIATLGLALTLLGCGAGGVEDLSKLPVAKDDAAIITENSNSINIDVLDNDTPNTRLDKNSIEVITNPTHGQAYPTSTGEIKYQPNAGYFGTDTLEYTVKDNEGNFSNPATVTITVLKNEAAFIITVNTAKTMTFPGAGTGNTSFQIPTKESGYNYNVDCGDGSAIHIGIKSNHTCHYATPGEYTIRITGDFPQIYFPNPPMDNEKLITIKQWGTQKWRSMSHAFQFCKNMTSEAIDIPDLSLVEDMSGMFLGAKKFQQANISDWDVSKVKNMQYLFYQAESFNNDITKWKVNSVTNMNHMFWHAIVFNQNISDWKVGNVQNMKSMFQYARKFNQNISDWNVHSAKTMDSMFSDATDFNGDISLWLNNSKIAKVTNMNSMFENAAAFNQNIGNWNVSAVSEMKYMFKGASSFSTANYDKLLNGWLYSSAAGPKMNVTFSAESTQYSSLSEYSRGLFISTYHWDITDGGLKP